MPNQTPTPMTISVGKNQQVTQNLLLTPSTDSSVSWILVTNPNSSEPPRSGDANQLQITFTSPACDANNSHKACSDESDRQKEKAIIHVSLPRDWTFPSQAIEITSGADTYDDISTEIHNNGSMLKATIHSLTSNEETIDYKFRAVFNGVTYTSPDPGVSVGRPR